MPRDWVLRGAAQTYQRWRVEKSSRNVSFWHTAAKVQLVLARLQITEIESVSAKGKMNNYIKNKL